MTVNKALLNKLGTVAVKSLRKDLPGRMAASGAAEHCGVCQGKIRSILYGTRVSEVPVYWSVREAQGEAGCFETYAG